MVSMKELSARMWSCDKCQDRFPALEWEIVADSSTLKLHDPESKDEKGIREGSYIGIRCPKGHAEIFKFLYYE